MPSTPLPPRSGAWSIALPTHGLRRGLSSFAPAELEAPAREYGDFDDGKQVFLHGHSAGPSLGEKLPSPGLRRGLSSFAPAELEADYWAASK
jgi:hypothetical protein